MQWLRYRAQSYLRGQQILQGLGVLPQGSACPLTFQDLAGNEFTLQVTPANEPLKYIPAPGEGPNSLYLENTGKLVNSDRSYSFAYAAATRVLYVRYLRCASDSGNPFPSFAAAVLQALDTNPVDSFALDLRDNAGGDANVIDPLLNGLAQRAQALLGNPNFRVYVVVNKGTFSSGMDNAMQFKSLALQTAAQYPSLGIDTRFIVIGEPTGGKPLHWGNVKTFTMPASQLGGQYSTAFLSAPSGIPNGPSFNPDVAVAMRSTDFFARFDPVLGAILARSNGAAPPPSGNVFVLNGASFRTEQGVAPGSFASGFGSFEQVPDQVLIASTSGHIASASVSQVNFIVPVSAPPGPTTISVRAAGVELATGQFMITASSPGLFILQPADPAQPGAVENQDYSVNSQSNPAPGGSVIQIFATGYGALDASGSAPVQAYIAELPAEVLFSGPIAPGLWQINARVPASLSGQASLFLISGNAVSNAVTIWVQ
ncbi:MAG: hypothetical protein JO307_14550 [Bryobacterales bacterium]|nr:hypothetical protein [Bryobacterales bacterium]MBV9402083.1 hypothetical protein [Bryobacterales bacterium]